MNRLRSLPVMGSVFVCSLILALTLVVNFGLGRLEAQANSIAIADDEKAGEVERWQHEAPAIYKNEARARARLRSYCALTDDLNGTLLAIVRTLNRNGVVTKAADYVANYPTPSPAQTAAQASLSAATALDIESSLHPTPTPAPTVQPTTPSQTQDAHVIGNLVVVTKPLELSGSYPAVIAALASLNDLQTQRPILSRNALDFRSSRSGALPLPLSILPPTLDRVGDTLISAKTDLTLSLPPPDLCVPQPAPLTIPHRMKVGTAS